jgi:tol-pal system protein YbgF
MINMSHAHAHASSPARAVLVGVRVALVAAGALGSQVGASGCARTAEERQLDEMRADIDRIQDDRDRADPSAAPVETAHRAPVTGGASPPADVRPPPPEAVVRVGAPNDAPPGDEDYADPEDTAPRPHIRVLGSPRVRGSGEVESVDEGSAAAAGSSPLDADAKRAYDGAMALVSAKQYERALDALAAFLVRWPDHPYSDHAMYWRGECYYARGDYARAAEQFEGVVARFPAGAKAPDALWKLGMARQRLGDAAHAREAYDRLRREYSQSDAARRLGQEGSP